MADNAFRRLQALLPPPPLLVARVTAHHDDDTSTVQLPAPAGASLVERGANVYTGALLRVRGRTVPVGKRAFIRAGVIETQAPDADIVEIVIDEAMAPPALNNIAPPRPPAPPPPPPPPPAPAPAPAPAPGPAPEPTYTGESITAIQPRLLGGSGLQLYNGALYSADDFFLIELPFSFVFDHVRYDRVYVGANSYVTFGSGYDVYSELGPSNPDAPAIHISSADRSMQRLAAGLDSPGVFRIRFDGYRGNFAESVPALVWELTIYAEPTAPSSTSSTGRVVGQMRLDIGADPGPDDDGFEGVYGVRGQTSGQWLLTMPAGSASETAYMIAFGTSEPVTDPPG